MVYEHLSRCFIPKYPSSWFSELFQVVIIIIHGDIPRLMALMLRLIDCWQWQKTLVVFVLLLWMRCFFYLWIAPLFYNFGGHSKSTYPPTNLEFQPVEAMKSFLLIFEPSSTYTLIGSWCRSMLKMFLITFFKLLFEKNCVMSKGFWRTLFFLLSSFKNHRMSL
jgi:hypothetical protein